MKSVQVSVGKKQKIVISLFVIILIVVFALVIKRVYVDRDYLLINEVVCDPGAETCFKRPCEECDAEGEEYEFYKKQFVSAKNVSMCNPSQGECSELICADTEGCQEQYCDETNVPEGEECSSAEDVSFEDEPSDIEGEIDEEDVVESPGNEGV